MSTSAMTNIGRGSSAPTSRRPATPASTSQFWSGNEVYWRTRWGNASSSDATPYRTLISYKETWANAPIDPTDQWTGTFRDPRFSPPAIGGGSPENALTGHALPGR